MMTLDQLKAANEKADKIKKYEELRTVYGNASKIAVGIPGKGPWGLDDQIVFLAEEIGDQILAALERRITNGRAELSKLGVE